MSTVVNALQEALGESSLVTGSALAERATINRLSGKHRKRRRQPHSQSD